MIALDTNVLLRYLLNDDPRQSVAARRLITGEHELLVTDIALVETLWTLKGIKYRLKKNDLAAVVSALFEESNLRFEDPPVVWRALDAFKSGKARGGKYPDFSDVLILEKAKLVAEKRSVRFGGMATFDKAAQRLPDVFEPN